MSQHIGDKITRRDVARRAGVAESTVSFVVNGRSRVAPETRQRVLDAIEELGYTPNTIARNLRARRSSFIGVIIPDFQNPLYGGIIKGIESTVSSAGYSVVVMCHSDDKPFSKIIQGCLEARMAAVISCDGGHPPEAFDPLIKAGLHVITCLYKLDHDAIFCVLPDYDVGIREATSYILSLGHRKICLIPGGNDPRLQLWQRYLDKPDTSICVYGPVNSTYAGAMTVLDEIPAWNATAIFATNDMTAIAALHLLPKKGMPVPEAISVVGHDDILLSRYSNPPLTTIRIFEEKLGQEAALSALELVGGITPKDRFVDTEFVVRESTAKVKKSALKVP